MKEWFTSMELVSLPGMPTTVQEFDTAQDLSSSIRANVRMAKAASTTSAHYPQKPGATWQEQAVASRASGDRSCGRWQGDANCLLVKCQ